MELFEIIWNKFLYSLIATFMYKLIKYKLYKYLFYIKQYYYFEYLII